MKILTFVLPVYEFPWMHLFNEVNNMKQMESEV